MAAGKEARVPVTVLVGLSGRTWLLDKATSEGVSLAAVVRTCLKVARDHPKEFDKALEAVRNA